MTDRDVVRSQIASLMERVQRPAGREFPAPYLVVSAGGNYAGNLFVWDHYHMALRFAVAGNPEFLRHLCDNVLHYQEGDGFTPNCILPGRGPRGSSSGFHAQPFLCRSAAGYVEATEDKKWAAGILDKLRAYLDYYDARHLAPKGLHRWRQTFHSGLDNDAATTFHLPGSVIPCDLSSWLVLEHRAMAALAQKLGHASAEFHARRSKALAACIEECLWIPEKESFGAWNLLEERPVFSLPDWREGDLHGAFTYQTGSNLIPLYAGVAREDRAAAMIRRYVLNPEHFWSAYGIRSLSRSSEFYNNAIWGNPPRFGDPARPTNSNWQGPVWFPLCLFMHRALRRYGFVQDAEELELRALRTLAESFRAVGSFAENFCGETGRPLYARDFAAWNLLADVMYAEIPLEFPLAAQ